MAKASPPRKSRKPVQPRGPGTAHVRLDSHDKPCNTHPKRTKRVDFSSEPGIGGDQILWRNGTPGIELVPSGMFVEGSDLLEEEGTKNDSDDVSDGTNEDSLIATIDARRANKFVGFSGDSEDQPDEPIRLLAYLDVPESRTRSPYIDNDEARAEGVPEDGDCGGMVVPYRCNRTYKYNEPTRKPKNASWKEGRSRQFQIGPDADERRSHRRKEYEANMFRLLAGTATCATDYDDMEQ